jgi:hypothetical protein
MHHPETQQRFFQNGWMFSRSSRSENIALKGQGWSSNSHYLWLFGAFPHLWTNISVTKAFPRSSLAPDLPVQ